LNLNGFAQRLFAHLKEDVLHPTADNTHLTLAGQVALIEEAAFRDVHGFHLRILRYGPVHIEGTALLAANNIVGAPVPPELHLGTHQVQVLRIGL